MPKAKKIVFLIKALVLYSGGLHAVGDSLESPCAELDTEIILLLPTPRPSLPSVCDPVCSSLMCVRISGRSSGTAVCVCGTGGPADLRLQGFGHGLPCAEQRNRFGMLHAALVSRFQNMQLRSVVLQRRTLQHLAGYFFVALAFQRPLSEDKKARFSNQSVSFY